MTTPTYPPVDIAVVSGGLDSTTLAYAYASLPDHAPVLGPSKRQLVLVSFDYGQRHRVELSFAARTAQRLGAEHVVLDLAVLGRLGGSALTDADADVPHGHYADENMRQTVVPNRNAIMLNVAVALAVTRGAGRVGTAVHAGDHPIYPDCRPAFIAHATELARVANEGFIADGFYIDAPFMSRTKADIVRLGDELGVPWTDTWSCYEGVPPNHCGRCGTCVERREAFHLAGVDDPTSYADNRASA